MQKEALVEWLTAYKKSWELVDPDLFVSLFSADATYQVSPFAVPMQGNFYEMWKGGRKRQAGNYINLEVWHVKDDTAIVQWIAHTIYFDRGPRNGNGIFKLRFTADGRCRELREWQHWHPHRTSATAAVKS